MKLIDIAVVLMFGSIEDEWTFSMLVFMKDKLCNKLCMHLDTIVYMFTKEIYIQESYPYQEVILAWKDQKVQIGVVF